MTRPVGEPSISKEQGSQDFGIRQLFRRPAQDACPCPVPWARLFFGGNTATTGTWTNANMTDGESYGEETPGDIFTFNDLGSRLALILEANGLYLVNMIVTWTNTFPEYRAIDMQQGLGDHLHGEGYGLTQSKGPFPTDGNDFFLVDHVTSFIFKSDSVNTPDPTLDPRVIQFSGVNRGFDVHSLRVMYLGEMGAEADWNFFSA